MRIHVSDWKHFLTSNEKGRDAIDPVRLAHRLYMLQALGVFAGIPALIGLVINYSFRSVAKNTLAESHFKYQLRTFWGGLILLVIGVLTLPWLPGFFILSFAGLWYFYRVVKGWSALMEQESMLVS